MSKLALLMAISLLLPNCATTRPVTSDQAACSVATARVAAERRIATSHVAFCDHIPSADSPMGYSVLALRAHCREALCGSTNMGWFAVEQATGQVFEWDVADSKLGRRVGAGF